MPNFKCEHDNRYEQSMPGGYSITWHSSVAACRYCTDAYYEAIDRIHGGQLKLVAAATSPYSYERAAAEYWTKEEEPA